MKDEKNTNLRSWLQKLYKVFERKLNCNFKSRQKLWGEMFSRLMKQKLFAVMTVVHKKKWGEASKPMKPKEHHHNYGTDWHTSKNRRHPEGGHKLPHWTITPERTVLPKLCQNSLKAEKIMSWSDHYRAQVKMRSTQTAQTST